MRQRLNLDLRTLDRFTLLVQAAYGAGKTHFVGDALRALAKQGPVRFLNIGGEDGYLSLAGMKLGEIGETVESVTDLDAALTDYRKEKLVGLGVDSVKALSDLEMWNIVGSKRMPDAKIDGERAKALWGHHRVAMQNRMNALRSVARYVICTCPSDKSEDEISGKRAITPDLIGKQAWGSAGWFDFVAFLQAEVVGPGKVSRKLVLAPHSNIVTRQRLPKAITTDIAIPEAGGGWAAFMGAVTKTLEEAA